MQYKLMKIPQYFFFIIRLKTSSVQFVSFVSINMAVEIFIYNSYIYKCIIRSIDKRVVKNCVALKFYECIKIFLDKLNLNEIQV